MPLASTVLPSAGPLPVGPRLRTTWVLVHPALLGALGLLALNDHVLKGAGLLPGWLTGKLSDLAGLWVALGLLSALLARRRGQVWALAGLVGAIFAAIKLDPTAAAWLEAATAGVGVPWSVTVDPTDLLALPVLVLGARWLVGARVAAPRAAVWTPARALAGMAAAAACMATSPPPGETVTPLQFESQVAVFNATGTELTVRIRPVRPEVELDCVALGLDPAAWLGEAAFGSATAWIMPVRSQVDAWSASNVLDCYAARLEVDGADPVVLFWTDELPVRQRQSPLAGHEAPDSQTVVISLGPGNRPVVAEAGAVRLLYDIDADARPEPAEECGLAERSERLDWAEPVPEGSFDLVDARFGPDGCWRLDLADGPESTPSRWYLCVPDYAFPFAAGDTVELAGESGSGGSAPGHWTAVRLTRAADVEAGILEAEVLASRGSGVPELRNVAAVAFEREADCGPVIDDCGTASRAGRVVVDLGDQEGLEAHTGDSLIPGPSQTLYVVHAAETLVADAACGSDLGVSMEWISVYTAAAEEGTP